MTKNHEQTRMGIKEYVLATGPWIAKHPERYTSHSILKLEATNFLEYAFSNLQRAVSERANHPADAASNGLEAYANLLYANQFAKLMGVPLKTIMKAKFNRENLNEDERIALAEGIHYGKTSLAKGFYHYDPNTPVVLARHVAQLEERIHEQKKAPKPKSAQPLVSFTERVFNLFH